MYMIEKISEAVRKARQLIVSYKELRDNNIENRGQSAELSEERKYDKFQRSIYG